MGLRKVYDINEFIDIMSGINDGAFATICYLSSANVKKTLRGSNVDAFGSDLDTYRTDGDDEYYNTLKQYQGGRIKKFPYNGVVKMSRIQFHWQSEKKYNKNFADYAKKRDDLIVKYGGEPVRKQGTDTKQEYGVGGVSVGDTENTQGRLYSHQNGATVKYLEQNYFLVDTDGRLKGGISKSAISNIISKTGSVDGVSALKKVNASEDDINSYIEEIKRLNFRVMKLMYDSILFVVATSNNEKIFFWNSKLANQVGSGSYIVNIDPSSFKQKAKELYQKSYEEIRNNSEIMESKKIKISENKLKQIVAESVKKVLNEENTQTEKDPNEIWKTRFFNQACQAAAWLNSAVTCYKFDPEHKDGTAALALKAHKILWDMVYAIRDRQKYNNELLDVDATGRVNFGK